MVTKNEVGRRVSIPVLPEHILNTMVEHEAKQPLIPVSDYPEEFLFALQLEQVRLARIPSEGRLQTLERVIKILSELLEKSNSNVRPEEEVRECKTLPKNFPSVTDEGGARYIPAIDGWMLRTGSETVLNKSEKGQEIWKIALSQNSFLEQCLIRLLQSDPKMLSQAEFDILFAFDLITARLVLSQEERERRIKSGRLNSELPTNSE